LITKRIWHWLLCAGDTCEVTLVQVQHNSLVLACGKRSIVDEELRDGHRGVAGNPHAEYITARHDCACLFD